MGETEKPKLRFFTDFRLELSFRILSFPTKGAGNSEWGQVRMKTNQNNEECSKRRFGRG